MKIDLKSSVSVLLMLGAFFIVGCSEVSEPVVNWNNYGDLVKERIDAYIESKNCGGFQKEFDAAADNSDNQRRRTGEGNGILMDYIIFHARKSGCAS